MPVDGDGPLPRGRGPERMLTSPAVVSELLEREGLMPKRGYGQNFLVDANVLRIITKAARLEAGDTAVEVGPGPGALTQALVERCAKVYAVESDENMIRVLRRELAGASNLVTIHADALEFDLESLWEAGAPERIKMVSNLPYGIAATLLVKWLQNYPWMREYTVMVQREVADRIVARPGGKDYSAASVKIQHRAEARRVANVSRNSFWPKPRVDSSIVSLSVGEQEEDAGRAATFDRVVTAAFAHRRKKLVNSVAVGIEELSQADVARALEEIGVSPGARAEELSAPHFARLAIILGSGLVFTGHGGSETGSGHETRT